LTQPDANGLFMNSNSAISLKKISKAIKGRLNNKTVQTYQLFIKEQKRPFKDSPSLSTGHPD